MSAITYEAPSYAGRSENEHNDCTLRATVAATGLSYVKVHAAFAKAGRKPCRGTYKLTQHAAWEWLGYRAVRTAHDERARTLGSLAKLLAKIEDTAPLIVYVRRHMLAFVNTRASEYYKPGTRIRSTWRLVKVVDSVNERVQTAPINQGA